VHEPFGLSRGLIQIFIGNKSKGQKINSLHKNDCYMKGNRYYPEALLEFHQIGKNPSVKNVENKDGAEKMSVEIIFKNVENKSIKPRLGGYSFLPENIDWPLNPNGDKLTLVLCLPTDFLNKTLNLNLPQDHVLSVFTTYKKDVYFLDLITFHGDKEELKNIKKGFTKVLLHEASDIRNESDFLIPAQEFIFGEELDLDLEELDEEDLDDIEIYCGSLIGNKPSLLQIENIGLDDYQFCLQIYGGDFPEGFQDIFSLSDSVGYLFINKNYDNDAGVFFTQCT